ncbi:MAG: helix-turn-helix domain-containing protein [Rhodococcus sp. (in: high G+C Gram-positive bacteria)]
MAAACPTRQVVGRIGDKWSLLVLYALSPGTLRFSQLRTRIEGVSQKMLTQTLRTLERDGLVSRQIYACVPPKVEYSLTPLGPSLSDHPRLHPRMGVRADGRDQRRTRQVRPRLHPSCPDRVDQTRSRSRPRYTLYYVEPHKSIVMVKRLFVV